MSAILSRSDGQKPSRQRITVLSAVVTVAFVLLSIHLFNLQVIQGSWFRTVAREVARREIPIHAPRGEIFDGNFDAVLVSNETTFAVDVIPGEVPEERLDDVFRKLAQAIDVPLEQIAELIPPKDYHLHQPIEVSGDVAFERIAFLAEHIDDFQGVTWHNKPLRVYEETGSIAHIIGFIGDITREELQILYNQGYNPGSVLGKSGVERTYDRTLRGVDGKRYRIVDVRERNVAQTGEDRITPRPGKDLVLTIDRELQRICEEALGSRIGSVVVLKPTTGEILAMVSYPYFDPNVLYDENVAEKLSELTLDRSSPFVNRAIESAYSPASVFKIIMTAAAVEEGLADTETECSGKLEYGGRVFHCWEREGHGLLGLSEALAQSCNVYFWKMGEALGAERVIHYARQFGLGKLSGIDLLGESSGFLPTPEWKKRTQHKEWVGGDTYNLSIGQGATSASPLQMANLVAMVVNEGTVYRPHVVKEIRDALSGRVIEVAQREAVHISSISRETFRYVKAAMRGVVVDGTAAVVVTTKATEVAGKTGTGETGVKKEEGEVVESGDSWFAAFAPYGAVSLDETRVVVVIVEAKNNWEWWAPKAANVIFQAMFADQDYDTAIRTLNLPWYAWPHPGASRP